MKERATRREFLRTAAGAAAMAAVGSACDREEPKGKRPNIVFILSDDQGYGDLGCYGATDLKTPCIDGLAAEGVRFTQYYAAAPECTPTRTALLTGRYLHRVGGLECAIGTTNVGRYDDAIRLAEKHELGLPVEETSIARMLNDAGYATAVYGKWHLGYEPKFLPRRHGFDQFKGILGGHCDYFHYVEITGVKTLYENDEPATDGRYMTDLITEESVKFIGRQSSAKPFFLYVAYTAPHSPYQGPKDRQPERVPKEKWDDGPRAKYAEMVEHMDKGVGQILKALADKGLADDTLVVFASDNGGDPRGSNAPFSGRKSSLYEGGIRVPCIARWPGALPKGVVSHQPCITMDLTASLARAAGVTPPRPFDGMDILGHVGAGAKDFARTLFWRARRGERTWRAVRDGSLKYLSRQDGEKLEEWLFDLEADPAEKNDLLAARPGDARRLKGLLGDWEKQVQHRR
ncbi:MAG TPA: sulfatase-like hydrolase/transferase [Planctomycetota bacterium]|nr:sulfatase-like hydrolase/transferase [Planctomycetota bacterium]